MFNQLSHIPMETLMQRIKLCDALMEAIHTKVKQRFDYLNSFLNQDVKFEIDINKDPVGKPAGLYWVPNSFKNMMEGRYVTTANGNAGRDCGDLLVQSSMHLNLKEMHYLGVRGTPALMDGNRLRLDCVLDYNADSYLIAGIESGYKRDWCVNWYQASQAVMLQQQVPLHAEEPAFVSDQLVTRLACVLATFLGVMKDTSAAHSLSQQRFLEDAIAYAGSGMDHMDAYLSQNKLYFPKQD